MPPRKKTTAKATKAKASKAAKASSSSKASTTKKPTPQQRPTRVLCASEEPISDTDREYLLYWANVAGVRGVTKQTTTKQLCKMIDDALMSSSSGGGRAAAVAKKPPTPRQKPTTRVLCAKKSASPSGRAATTTTAAIAKKPTNPQQKPMSVLCASAGPLSEKDRDYLMYWANVAGVKGVTKKTTIKQLCSMIDEALAR